MAKTAAWVFGAILAIVGIWGFVQAPVLGIFNVNALHNIVHLASGLLLLGAAMGWFGSARMMLIILGVVYAIVAVLGFIMPDFMMSLLMSDMVDAWLHVALAVVFLGVAFMEKEEGGMQSSMGGM